MKQDRTLGQDVIAPITELLKTDYLKESNILNSLPVAVYVCDAEGIITSYNKKAVELWGRTPKKGDKDERFCGAYKLHYPDGKHMPHEETPVAACLIDGLPRKDVEVIIEKPNSSQIVVRVNIAPIKDDEGNVTGMVNCFYDITEEKKAQSELNRKTSQLQDYVDNAAIGLHWVDENGIILWANKAELEMLGYSEEEYIGHPISEFHADEHKINDILQRLNCDETLSGYESELRCKDGSTRIVQISSNVFRHEGKFIHTRCFTVDITEQKRLFQSLKESENRYRQLIENVQTPLYTVDADGRIAMYNKAAENLWARKPIIGKELWCGSIKAYTLKGEVIPLDKAPMAECIRTGKSTAGQEIVIERVDGSKRTVIPYPTPLFDATGKLTGAINVIIDITDRKTVEKALRESESRYRQLVESLHAAIYTTDEEGRIVLYNKAAVDLWGREPEIGKDFWCGSYKILKTDGSELPLGECPMAVALKEKRPVLGEEIIVVRPDGTTRTVAPHPQPIFDESGKVTGAVNMLVDITDIKRSEKALRENEKKLKQLTSLLERKVEERTQDLKTKNDQLKRSEERYHKMIDEVEDYAIILLDKNGTVQNWNKGAEKIKGYKEGEIVGKNFSVFYLPEDRDRGLHVELLNRAREKGKAIHEGWRRRKDGTTFWGSIVLTALHDDQNRVIGFSKVTRDLTERKLAEDKLQEYANELEFQNKELEQFAYAASHDMKEPLRKIHFYNSFIAENSSNSLDDKSKEFLNRSLGAVKRMTGLIEDLLTYSKTTANVENFEEVDVNEIVEEIILVHKEELEQKNASIEIVNSLPVINSVPFQFKQLMDNLINNSIKYKHPDRTTIIKISCEVANGLDTKEKEAEPNTEYYKISLTDNGVGFEPQYAEKIFEIFQRLNNQPAAKGTGIGLAICKKIVQNHKGFIKAIGEPNEGARFDIYIPVTNH